MATRKLLIWFKKRRKSKTLDLAQQQISLAINTVSELEKAVLSFSKGEKSEVEESIQQIFSKEVEIDDLRRSVLEELTESKLPVKYREDLKGLVEHLDIMADYVKDSSRSLKILIDTIIPMEILDEYIRIAHNLKECAIALGESIEIFGIDPSQAIELSKKVDLIESQVDDEYIKIKLLFIKYSEELNVPILLELRDLANYMEQTADMCADTADFIRVLAEGELSLS